MTDRAALVAAVIAAPADDTPRLVFADFLDDAGSPADAARAAFIRAEVEAARLTENDPERVRLEAVAAAHFNRFADAWAEELPAWVSWGDSAVAYERGFVHRLISHRGRLREAGQLFAVAPVRAVQIRSRTGHFFRSTLDAVPEPHRIEEVKFGPFGSSPAHSAQEVFADLLADRRFARLTVIDVGGLQVTSTQLAALARDAHECPWSATLVSLDLSDTRITDTGVYTLAAARGFPALQVVDVAGSDVTPRGVAVLRERFGVGVRA